MDLDLNYFCLTTFVLDLIILFWTSWQLSVQFWDCRLLYWKVWFSGIWFE